MSADILKNKMMDKRLKIGVAGAGSMGANHIRILSEQNSIFDLVGIFDPNLSKKSIADKYGVRFFDSYEQLLKEVDALVLASPTSTHFDMAIMAASFGVNTLVEKPIAESVEQAEKIIETFRRAGLVLGVSYVERYSPVIRALQDLIANEEIIAIEAHRCSPFDKRIFDVDVVSDLMCHDVDIIVNAIMGEMPEKITAKGRKAFTDSFADYAQAVLEFKNGVLAFDTASRSTQDKIRLLAIHAREAYIEADMLHKTLVVKRGIKYKEDRPNMFYSQSSTIEQIVLPNQEPLKEDLLNFGRAVLYGEPLLIQPEQIIRSMKVLDAVHNEIYRDFDLR